MTGLLKKLTGLEEKSAVKAGLCFLFFFFLLAGYYIIQPLRDELGLLMGKEYTPWLFGASMLAMLVLNPIFGLLLNRRGRVQVVKTVYRFFAFNLLAFIVVFKYLEASGQMVSHGTAERVDGLAFVAAFIFFLWASVFNLFATSVFWTLMADIYTGEQSKKVFGFLGAGGTLGQVFGSGLTSFIVKHVEGFHLTNLLILSVLLLEAVVQVMLLITRDYEEPLRRPEEKKPHALSGLTDILKSKYLIGICLFLFLYTFTSSFIYFQKQAIVEDQLSNRADRVGFFSNINFVISLLTLGIQLFLTGKFLSIIGLSAGLSLVPVITLAGFVALLKKPDLITIALLDIFRKTTNYAISRPAREVLFTAVSRREKYLAKNFIDTVIYRLGDSGAAAIFEYFFQVGASALAIAASGVVATLGYLAVGIGLGKAHGRRIKDLH